MHPRLTNDIMEAFLAKVAEDIIDGGTTVQTVRAGHVEAAAPSTSVPVPIAVYIAIALLP